MGKYSKKEMHIFTADGYLDIKSLQMLKKRKMENTNTMEYSFQTVACIK
jgi:hypothetical protein